MTRLTALPDGRLQACLESTPGFPAIDLVTKRLGAHTVRLRPAELLEPGAVTGDLLVACIAGSSAARQAARLLHVRFPSLPASGYHIGAYEYAGGKALCVIGGDVFGMLAGLAEALLWCDRDGAGLTYRGGGRTERPAFPLRYYWTWDHSTNWVLDDPGNQVSGCSNPYLKRPETFLEDYRRLIDHCLEMRCNGLLIWGFLRDAHGGERAAYQVARYAAERGIALLPGVGTTGYGGVYYEGEHPCNLETYLARHPERGNVWEEGGAPSARELSPYHPQNRKWMARCLEWLYTSFPIGGANLENMDLMVDHSARGARGRRALRTGEADHFKDQYYAYREALETIHVLAPQAWNTYATYSGFGRGGDITNAGADMGREPYLVSHLPESALAQWTLTGMLSSPALPLRAWLRDPRPAAVYANPRWPRELRPPGPRATGFVHQPSQWVSHVPRNSLTLSTFAEACLRAHEAGLEGISVHGEVSARTLAWELNYLALRHWSYHAESTLEEFAAAELSRRVGGEVEAQQFVEALCLLDEGRWKEAGAIARAAGWRFEPHNHPRRGDLDVFRRWQELWTWCHLQDPRVRSVSFTDVL